GDHFAARAFHAPTVEHRLRLGEITPVVQPILKYLSPAKRNMDERIAIPAAGFDQQHPRANVLRQAVGERASSRAGADNDVVVGRSVLHCRSLVAEKSRLWLKGSSELGLFCCDKC